MSRSDWLKFAKIIGLTSAALFVATLIYGAGFYTGNGSGYYHGQADRAASQYPSDTKRIIDGCFQLPSRPDAAQCIAEATTASHENQRAEYDLNAQRDMADWAWWVMVVGILQFFATIATLGFVKLTLDATLEAVKDTGEATKAMVRQNEIAENGQRPWIGITFQPRFVRTHSASLRVEVDVFAKNVGQTPAFDYNLFVRAFFKEGPEGSKAVMDWFDDVSLKVEPSRKTLVPNATDRWPYHYGIHKSELDDESPVIIIAASAIYKTAKTAKRWERIDQAVYVIRRDTEGFDAAFPIGDDMMIDEGLEMFPLTSAPLSAYWTNDGEDD